MSQGTDIVTARVLVIIVRQILTILWVTCFTQVQIAFLGLLTGRVKQDVNIVVRKLTVTTTYVRIVAHPCLIKKVRKNDGNIY